MSASYDSRQRRSRSSSGDHEKRSPLAKVSKSELTKVKVAIKRTGLISKDTNSPLVRDIDDPAKICTYVHIRKGNPIRVPIFGKDIKVNQDFSEDRTVFTNDKNTKPSRKSRSRSTGDRCRSRSKDKSLDTSRGSKSSKDRSRNETRRSKSRERSRKESRRSQSRHRSKSRDKNRKSRERIKRRSPSRTRSTSSRRSRSRERRHSLDRRKYRGDSQERSRSRSRSITPIKHRYESRRSPKRQRRRSFSPLRPGEYRPGHPDLALRPKKRKSSSRSRSRSPRSTSKCDKIKEKRPSAAAMPMPGMEYGFFEGYGPVPMMPPFRGRFPPMVDPSFYPRMYPPNMMMPRMPMNPMMAAPWMNRPRWPQYNSGQNKSILPAKAATITSRESKPAVIEDIEQPKEDTQETNGVSSSDKRGEEIVSGSNG